MSIRDRVVTFLGGIGELFLFTLIVGGLTIAEWRERPVGGARRIGARRSPKLRLRIPSLADVVYRLQWTARYGGEHIRIGLYRVAWFGRHLRGRSGNALYRVRWLVWHVRDGVRVRFLQLARRTALLARRTALLARRTALLVPYAGSALRVLARRGQWLFWHVRDGVRVRWAALAQRPGLHEPEQPRSRLPYGRF